MFGQFRIFTLVQLTRWTIVLTMSDTHFSPKTFWTIVRTILDTHFSTINMLDYCSDNSDTQFSPVNMLDHCSDNSDTNFSPINMLDHCSDNFGYMMSFGSIAGYCYVLFNIRGLLSAGPAWYQSTYLNYTQVLLRDFSDVCCLMAYLIIGHYQTFI